MSSKKQSFNDRKNMFESPYEIMQLRREIKEDLQIIKNKRLRLKKLINNLGV